MTAPVIAGRRMPGTRRRRHTYPVTTVMTDLARELLRASFITGRYTLRELATEYRVSTATVWYHTRDLTPAPRPTRQRAHRCTAAALQLLGDRGRATASEIAAALAIPAKRASNRLYKLRNRGVVVVDGLHERPDGVCEYVYRLPTARPARAA